MKSVKFKINKLRLFLGSYTAIANELGIGYRQLLNIRKNNRCSRLQRKELDRLLVVHSEDEIINTER